MPALSHQCLNLRILSGRKPKQYMNVIHTNHCKYYEPFIIEDIWCANQGNPKSMMCPASFIKTSHSLIRYVSFWWPCRRPEFRHQLMMGSETHLISQWVQKSANHPLKTWNVDAKYRPFVEGTRWLKGLGALSMMKLGEIHFCAEPSHLQHFATVGETLHGSKLFKVVFRCRLQHQVAKWCKLMHAERKWQNYLVWYSLVPATRCHTIFLI